MKKVLWVLLLAMLMLSVIFVATPAMAEGTGATIWTDKADYGPEETVTIFGSGFLADAQVTISIEAPDLSVATIYALTDGSGAFTAQYKLDGMEGTYTVTATDGTNTATTTFTEPVKIKTYRDSAYTYEEKAFIQGSTVYAKATGLDKNKWHKIEWFNPSAVSVRAQVYGPPDGSTTVRTDSYTLSSSATVGAWTVKVFDGDSSSGPWTQKDAATFNVWSGSTPPGGWPTSWVLIDTDGDEGGGKDWRDVSEAYINYDANYLYLKFKTRQQPAFPTSSGDTDQDKYRWFIDVEGNMYWSGGRVYEAEYLLSVQDKDDDGIGEIYLLTDTDNDGSFDDESWTQITNTNVGGFRIVPSPDNQLEMYISWSSIGGMPPIFWLTWDTDNADTNLNQCPELDRPDEKNIIIQLGAISGYKWNDLNGDGVKDTGEPGLPDWTINLSGPVSRTTTTGSDGFYQFLGLLAGTYTVSEEPKDGWTQTYPTPIPPGTHNITLEAGQNSANNNFGNCMRLSKTTTLLSASEITLGESVTDTATVTGVPGIPTGTVEFYVMKSGGSWSLFSTKTLDASGKATSDSYTPKATEGYYFKAKYLGDTNYPPSESGDKEEPLEVGPADSKTATELSKSEIALGESVTDTVTVTGLDGSFPMPTGTVEFYVKKPIDSWTLFSTKKLDASGKATSDSYTPLATGTYYFKAVYLGDSNYKGSESDPETEKLIVNPADSKTVTELLASTITLGDSVTDKATVTGLGGSYPVPTGKVEFWVLPPGGVWTKYDTKILDASGMATSDPYTPLSAGTWYFKAKYLGDANYKPSESGDKEEPLEVKLYTPKVETLLSASEITLGDSIKDKVTVTGLPSPFPSPTGDVEFYVSTDAIIWTKFDTKTLDASGTATSDSYTPLKTGDYYFKAKYLGDANYKSAESGDTEEPLKVKPYMPKVKTELSATEITLGESVTDTVTVYDLPTPPFPVPSGTVEFYVRKGTAAWSLFSTKTLDSSGKATSDPYTPKSAEGWFFKAVYKGDSNYNSAESGDTEEPLKVKLYTPKVETLLSASEIDLGQSVTDTVTVTGLPTTETFPGPTGTVEFYVMKSDGDGFSWTLFSTKTLDASGMAVSDPYTPLLVDTTDTYYFKAKYLGDANYKPSESGDAEEPLFVKPIPPTVKTKLSADVIDLGNSITDTVTVTGLGAPFPDPTGSVEFYVSTDGGVTWTKFGSTKTLVGGSATSDSYTPLSVGDYYFKAKYLGDSNYLPAESGAAEEPLKVKPVVPATADVTFAQVGVGTDFTGTVLTVDGTINLGVGDLPKTFTWTIGSVHTFAYYSPLVVNGGKQYVWTSTSGLSTAQSGTITVPSGGGSVTGYYKTQFKITFGQSGVGIDFTGTVVTIDGTNYRVANLPVSFWWDDGSTHSFSFASPLVVNSGKRYAWTTTTGLSTLQKGTLTITKSGSVTGYYKAQR